MRIRLRNASPIGDIASETCKFNLTRSKKKLNSANGVVSSFLF